MEGFMTPEQAERAVWAYFYQLDHQQDRRSSPISVEPTDRIGLEEAKRLKDQESGGLFRGVALRALESLSKREGRVGFVARGVRGLTEAAKRKFFEEALTDMAQEAAEDRDLTGQLDPNTGLPMSASDLQSGRGVVTGVDLCMEAIIPPFDLAAAAIEDDLGPCPDGEDPITWGTKPEHFQVLAFKPKEIQCTGCGGRGFSDHTESTARTGMLFLIRGDDRRTVRARCSECEGKGTLQGWTPENVAAVKHSAREIGDAVGRLAHEGYFDQRPIDSRDVEMGDLVWETKGDGHSLGFRLTWKGYQRMKEYCALDPEIQSVPHLLAMAGHEVRARAPKWALRGLNEARPAASISTGGPQLSSGGKINL